MLFLLACAPADTNEPPEIVETPFLDGATVEIAVKGDTSFYVIAEDVDGDPLEFAWALSEDGPVEGLDIVGREGSQLDLAWAESLDGQVLSCDVSDPTHTVSLSWTLTVEDITD